MCTKNSLFTWNQLLDNVIGSLTIDIIPDGFDYIVYNIKCMT